jgi:hypothetical protein
MLCRVDGRSSGGCFAAMVPADAWPPWSSLLRLHYTAAYHSVESSLLGSVGWGCSVEVPPLVFLLFVCVVRFAGNPWITCEPL